MNAGVFTGSACALPILAMLAVATGAAGQGAEPKGPADIIGGAQRSRATREMEQAGKRAQGSPDNPHAAAGHPGLAAGPKEPPPIAIDRADPLLATGTIQVLVYDRGERPAANAEVSLGVMAADGGRTSIAGRTDASGIAMFSGLAAGDKQAYRVNVPYRGAKYSSNPFRLPMTGGHRVEIRRAPVTRDARMVVLYVGATSIELKDERLKVVQQARLLNLGADTYVFPDKGTLVPLPEGFMAVQTEETMGDQRLEQAAEGLRVRGSLPPGEVTLLWGFDLPFSGTEARFTIEVPWLTFAYRVIADAPEGMSLAVEGMPEPQLHEDGGRRFLVTEVQRKVGDTPFRTVQVTLRGIPGPGPGRFIAVGLALLVIAGGVAIARRQAPRGASTAQDLARRKQELLTRAKQAATEHAAGETGPKYHEERLRALEDELAALLLEERRAQESAQRR